MAPLPATAFILVGAIVSIVSLLRDELQLFIIAGAAFILIGIFKAIKNYKKVSIRQDYNTQPAQTHTSHNTKRCFVCSAKNHADANFCGHCGHKLT